MTFVIKCYIKLADGQIHLRKTAAHEGKIPLVMLHQTASSSVMYEAIMGEIGGEKQLIAVDTPGYGASYDPPHQASIAYYAEVMQQVLKEMNVERYHLFGHHTGAAIAVEMVTQYPESVEKLILSGPPLLSEAQKEALKSGLTKGQTDLSGKHLQAVWERIRARSLTGNIDLIQRETLLTLRASRYQESYYAVFEQDFAAQLREIRCPTLIICGEKDTIRDSAEPAQALIPQSRLEIVPDAGTYICDENAEILVAILRRFLSDE